MRSRYAKVFASGFLSGVLSLYVSLSLGRYVLQSANQIELNEPSLKHELLQRKIQQDFPETESVQKNKNTERLLCWISTTPKFKSRALTVKDTWGRRCDTLLFMSPEADADLPTVALSVPDGRPSLWGKTVHAWTHVYNNYLDKADWFYKADDDTYAVIDNLRSYLAGLNSSQPLYLGFHFKSDEMPNGFLSGGAGYVLTRESIRRFVEIGMNQKNPLCNTDLQGADDWNVGLCMHKLNVTHQDTRDTDGKLRFMPWKLDDHVIDEPDKNQSHTPRGLSRFPYPSGRNCCSPSAISFHYVRDAQPYVYEYLIYDLKRNVAP